MRKIIVFTIIVLILSISFIYFFIPSTIKITATNNIKCTVNELNTCLRDQVKWREWFPVKKEPFLFNEFQYSEKEQKLNGVDIDISNPSYVFHSSLIGLSLTPDSLLVSWSTEIKNDFNPIARINRYIEAARLQKAMDVILDSLKSFASQPINVYGFNIHKTSFNDSLLLSKKLIYISKPGLEEQYRVINSLKDYITSKRATIIDSPMVNMAPDANGYRMQIAIGIDHEIAETDEYKLIRMVHINGNYVTADVLGGPDNIQKAHEQIEEFMKDHFLTSPGIPFEIYITDRKKELESSKWKTRIYYPST